MKVKNITGEFKRRLHTRYHEKEVMQFLYLLFEEYLLWTKTELISSYDKELTEAEAILFDKALTDLENDRPIQYIIGKTWFNDRQYGLSPDVLIPRSETEELCHLVFKNNIHRQYEEFSMLDIGTGSGIIAIDLKLRFPYSKVEAVDISLAAIEIARVNAINHNCNIVFRQGDILDLKENEKSGKFDIIISNPPYVLESERAEMRRNVYDYEPPVALFVPDDNPLLFYDGIISYALKHLSQPGNIYLEINERFGQEIKARLLTKGFEKVEVIRDIHEKDRFIHAALKPAVQENSYWYADKE